jgi:hypothetical protein
MYVQGNNEAPLRNHCCSMHTDIQMDGHKEAIVTFGNFANAPKKSEIYPFNSCKYSVRLSQETAIISMNRINEIVFNNTTVVWTMMLC